MDGWRGGREGRGGVLGFLGSLYMRTGIGPWAGYPQLYIMYYLLWLARKPEFEVGVSLVIY